MNQAANLTLTEERTFTAHLHGQKITGLEVAGEWEGFTKFAQPASGLHLIVLMAEARVVTGSPSFMSSLGMVADEHFVTVPDTTLPDGRFVPSFQYAKYPCAKSADGKALLSPSEKPWVNINYNAAVAACAAAGYQLSRESQELAIRHNVAQQPINWTSGGVGEGKVFQGLHKGSVNSAQAADYVSDNSEERSWHELSNGERVYGLAGNIYTWVHDDVQGDELGLTGKIAADSPSLAAPYPSREKGMGYRPDGASDWSGRALVRGGYWYSGENAGVFCLGSVWPGGDGGYVGFRCTKP